MEDGAPLARWLVSEMGLGEHHPIRFRPRAGAALKQAGAATVYREKISGVRADRQAGESLNKPCGECFAKDGQCQAKGGHAVKIAMTSVRKPAIYY